MTKIFDITDSNSLAELRENSGDPSYLEDAATYYDDDMLNTLFLLYVADKFAFAGGDYEDYLESALKNIFQHFIQYETYPDWIEPLIDRVAKERFDDSQD